MQPWFESISLKTQPHTVNTCVKRSSQRSYRCYCISGLLYFISCQSFNLLIFMGHCTCAMFLQLVNYLKCAAVVVDVCPVQEGHDCESSLNRTDLNVGLDFEGDVLNQTLTNHDSHHLERTKILCRSRTKRRLLRPWS